MGSARDGGEKGLVQMPFNVFAWIVPKAIGIEWFQSFSEMSASLII